MANTNDTHTGSGSVAADIPGNIGSSAVLEVGRELASTVDVPGGQDWYRIELMAGQVYRFDLRSDNSSVSPLSDPYLRLYNTIGNLIAENDDSGSLDSRLFFSASENVTLFASAGGLDEATGDYRLSAQVVDRSTDIPGDASSSAVLAIGGEAASIVDIPGDQDWYGVDLVAGQFYRFDLLPDDAAGNPLNDQAVRIYDSSGALLSERSGTSFYQAAASGVFFASAGSFGEAIGDYRLSALLVDLSTDISGDASSSAVLAIGGEAASIVDIPGDQDWYGVDLVAGQFYRFDLLPDDAAGNPLNDQAVRIYDSSGALLSERSGTSFYQAAASGVFFASAGSFGEATGDYRLSVQLVDLSTDVPGDASSLAVLAIGGEAASTIEIFGDQDWYRAELTAGQVYRFDLLPNDAAGNPLSDLAVRIYDGNGVLLSERFGTSYYQAPASGIFFASAGTFGEATGDYRLSAQLVDLSTDIPGDASSSAVLAIGGEAASIVDIPGDQDWYRVELTAGQVYRFDLLPNDAAGNPLNDLAVRIYDGNGALLSERSGTSFYQAAASGIFFASAGAFGEAIGDYRLTAQVLDLPDNIPGNVTTSAQLTIGGEAASTVDYPGDENWFRVDLTAGQLYRFDLLADDGTGNPLGDPAVRLYDGNGILIGERSQTLFHEASETGTIFASAGGFGDAVGDYRLSARPVDLSNDVPGDASTSSILRVGGAITSSVDFPGDENWFRVELRAGELYRFDLRADDGAGDPLSEPAVRLYDADGVLLDEQSQTLVFAPARSDTFFASAGGSGDSVGDYQLGVRSIDLSREIRGDIATVAVIPEDCERAGRIDFPFDQDWFRVSLTAGTNYRFELRSDGETRQPLTDAYLRLFNTDGSLVGEDDDGGGDLNSLLFYQADVTATYFVSAGGYSTSEGRYLLSVSPADAIDQMFTASVLPAAQPDMVLG